jgi:hypothetical protein
MRLYKVIIFFFSFIVRGLNILFFLLSHIFHGLGSHSIIRQFASDCMIFFFHVVGSKLAYLELYKVFLRAL